MALSKVNGGCYYCIWCIMNCICECIFVFKFLYLFLIFTQGWSSKLFKLNVWFEKWTINIWIWDSLRDYHCLYGINVYVYALRKVKNKYKLLSLYSNLYHNEGFSLTIINGHGIFRFRGFCCYSVSQVRKLLIA